MRSASGSRSALVLLRDAKREQIGVVTRELAEHDHDDVELWVWSSGDGVVIADLSAASLIY